MIGIQGGIFTLGCYSFACILQMITNVSHVSLDLYQQNLFMGGRKKIPFTGSKRLRILAFKWDNGLIKSHGQRNHRKSLSETTLCQDKSLNVDGTFAHVFKLLKNVFIGKSELVELDLEKKK